MKPGPERSDDRGGLAHQLVPDGWREQQRIGILRHVGGRGVVGDGAALWPQQAGDQLQERRLTRPISTHQRRDLATTKDQRHSLHGRHALIAVIQPVDPAEDRALPVDGRRVGPGAGQALRMDASIT